MAITVFQSFGTSRFNKWNCENTTKAVYKTEYGDLQTPQALAEQVCAAIGNAHAYKTIVEPTCGEGSLLLAALKHYSSVSQALGLEVNPAYVADLKSRLKQFSFQHVEIVESCFFSYHWDSFWERQEDPVLLIANPPWVTNSDVGLMTGTNLPHKKNVFNLKGMAALTGKSNFDISEYIMLDLMKHLNGRTGTCAVLCKTSVARKVLKSAWKAGYAMKSSKIKHIDARLEFSAAVDACLLICEFKPGEYTQTCSVYSSITDTEPVRTFGLCQGEVVADIQTFEKYAYLMGSSSVSWRSGIKHDCAAIMELSIVENGYVNGLGESVDIEPEILYPLLKSSDIYNGHEPRKCLIVTQRYVGEDTRYIESLYPKAWDYLNKHREKLNQRKSSIYRNKPQFSIFGVGNYSFSLWKIAISGLYKSFKFRLISPVESKPVMLDDTAYFIECRSVEEAEKCFGLLHTPEAQGFLLSLVFWDSKRPITSELLKKLNLFDMPDQKNNSKNYPIQLKIV